MSDKNIEVVKSIQSTGHVCTNIPMTSRWGECSTTVCKLRKKSESEIEHDTAEKILLPIYELCKERGSITIDDVSFLFKRFHVEVKE